MIRDAYMQCPASYMIINEVIHIHISSDWHYDTILEGINALCSTGIYPGTIYKQLLSSKKCLPESLAK